MLDLYLDVDALAVYPQVLSVAQRRLLELYVMTKDYLRADDHVHLILIEEEQANAGAWIAANISRGDVCVTGDSSLAASCALRAALALLPTGRPWDSEEGRSPAAIRGDHWPLDARTFVHRLEHAIASLRGRGPHPFGPAPGFSRPERSDVQPRPSMPQRALG